MLLKNTYGATHPTVPHKVCILFGPDRGSIAALMACPKSVMMALAPVPAELMRMFSGLRSL